MTHSRLTRIEGVVAAILDAGRFSVELPGGDALRARISRRLGFLHPRFAVGDRVLLGLRPSPSREALILTGTKPASRTQGLAS